MLQAKLQPGGLQAQGSASGHRFWEMLALSNPPMWPIPACRLMPVPSSQAQVLLQAGWVIRILGAVWVRRNHHGKSGYEVLYHAWQTAANNEVLSNLVEAIQPECLTLITLVALALPQQARLMRQTTGVHQPQRARLMWQPI